MNPTTQQLEILNESHYYPFGMEQDNPRFAKRDEKYKYKYQGQERQDELNLNWDSFKWRNYDYAIGRFMSVDPLAEDYVHQTPYAFAENKVFSGVELEGLEFVFTADGKLLFHNKGSNQILIQRNDASISKPFGSLVRYSEGAMIERSNVSSTIYNKEVRGDVKLFTSEPNSASVGASVTKIAPNTMNINPQNSNNGDLLNNDYYNQKANMKHEDGHSQNLLNGSNTANELNAWNHFDTHMESIISNSDFDKTTENYKDFSKRVANGYLIEMSKSIEKIAAAPGNESVWKTNDYIQYAVKRYNEAVKTFNCVFNGNLKARTTYDEWSAQ